MGCKKRKLWEKTIRNKSRRQHGRRALDKTKPRRDPRSTNVCITLTTTTWGLRRVEFREDIPTFAAREGGKPDRKHCGYIRIVKHSQHNNKNRTGIDSYSSRRKVKQLRVKLRIDGVSRVTCCHPWSQGLVRGASARFVTLRPVLHLMTGLPMQLSSERQGLTAREADYPDTAHGRHAPSPLCWLGYGPKRGTQLVRVTGTLSNINNVALPHLVVTINTSEGFISSPDLKNKVRNTGWEEARDWLLPSSQSHRYSPGQWTADCVELHQIDLRKDMQVV
uniref:Uncharacterized protein n=1 Tax=Timema douglasi TaxID=61478 RepID=A0A7R8VVS3_TIMDO|nr:unnamed protein product [Timema douglasi]